MQLLKLDTKQIKIGSPLPFNVRDEWGHLLLACGQVVTSEGQLHGLVERGMSADIEEIKTLAAGRKVEATTHPPTVFARWRHAAWALDDLLKSLDQAEFPARCDALAKEVMALVSQDCDFAIYTSVRQETSNFRTYGLNHALHAAALCQMVATRLEWSPPRIFSAVRAALTMNLSIVELQGNFAVYGRLSQEQRDELRLHPEQAEARLRAAGVVDEDWLQAVRQHHEHIDGKGYPSGITDVAEMPQLLRLADVFLAKISARESRPSLGAKEAGRQAYAEWPGSNMVLSLIKEYGVYPPGELVALASGEKGVVIHRGATMQTPIVATLTDKKGLPISGVVKRDTAVQGFAIVGMETDKNLVSRLPPERVYGLTS